MSHNWGEKDLILENFEEIKTIALEYGLKLNREDNLIWDAYGSHALSVHWNATTWILKIIDGKYSLFHVNTSANRKGSPGKSHLQYVCTSYISAIKRLCTTHSPKHMVKTKKSSKIDRMNDIFDQLNKK